MFGFQSRTERLYEARIADLKKEHQRTVEALTAWIEQLQLQQGAPIGSTQSAAQSRQAGAAPPPNEALYMGEEEEAIYDAHANGMITDEQLSESLQQLNFLNKEVIGQ